MAGRPGAGAGEWTLLSLGANLGEPAAQLRAAVGELEAVLSDLRASSVYRTEPVGRKDQPDFLNLVCAGRSREPPRALLERVRRIEARFGRTRPFRHAPRTLDIDLLDVGGRLVDEPELVLPHPHLHERAFVLVPLAEVTPEWRHPRLGATAGELLRALPAPERVERLGPLEE